MPDNGIEKIDPNKNKSYRNTKLEFAYKVIFVCVILSMLLIGALYIQTQLSK